MGKNGSKSRRTVTVFLTAAIFAALLIVGAGILLGRVTARMNNSANEALMTSSRMIGESIENGMEKDEELLAAFSELLPVGDEEILVESLRDYQSTTSFFNLIYMDINGEGIDSLGNKILSSELAFQDVALSRNKTGVSQAYQGSSGRLQVAYQKPVIRDGQQAGAIYGEKILNSYNVPSLFSFSNGNGRAYVINAQDGKWLIEGRGVGEADDIYDYLRQQGNKEDVCNTLKKYVKEGKSGTITVKYDKKECLLGFLKLDKVKGSCLISVIPIEALQQEGASVIKMIRSMLVLLILAMVFIIALLLGRQRMKGKAEQKEYREKLFQNLSANTNFAFLVYTPASHKTELVSDNMCAILGMDRKKADSAEKIFEQCGIGADDKDRTAFMDGRLDSMVTRECMIGTGANELKRWIAVNLMKADYGQYLLVLSDTTKEHHMRENLADALEQARDINRSKTSFFSAMSHDIRTPMNGIVGMTNIALANLDNPPKVRACLDKITAASGHLLSLINEVLDMAKIESGKLCLKEEEVHLPSLIANVLEFIKPEVERKSQTLNMKSLILEYDTIVSDALHIQKILLNLLSNAVKYTQEGGNIDLHIGEEKVRDGHIVMSIVVEDNGVGMTKEFQERIFQPFEREDMGKGSQVSGTGLGMAIVKSIVDMMDGEISVESEENRGSRFTVELPFVYVSGAVEKVTDLEGYPVLVVDDDRDTCESISIMLRESGLVVSNAFSGKDAVQMVKEVHARGEDYFSVILDWKMPEMDGIEAARQIKDAVQSEVPILLLSAYDWDNIEEDAICTGISDFLRKPVFKSELLDKLRNYAGKGGLRKQEKTASEEIQPDFNGEKVLVAEDNDLNREIITEILMGYGLEVDTAIDGKEAVEHFERSVPGEYQMIFMDINMPVMNGLDATRCIRTSAHPDSTKIPVIAMTADVFREDIKRCMNAGMNAHIGKPVEMNKLVEVLNQFSRRKDV